MKKLSSINEGWGTLVRRDLTDEVRDEERIEFDEYLKGVEWVDLGNRNVLYAKYDIVPDIWRKREDERLLSYDDIKNLRLPQGVSIITNSQVQWLEKHCDMNVETTVGSIPSHRYPWCVKCSREGYGEIYFNTPHRYDDIAYVTYLNPVHDLEINGFTIMPFKRMDKIIRPFGKDKHIGMFFIGTGTPKDEMSKKHNFLVKLVKKKS